MITSQSIACCLESMEFESCVVIKEKVFLELFCLQAQNVVSLPFCNTANGWNFKYLKILEVETQGKLIRKRWGNAAYRHPPSVQRRQHFFF